MIKITFPDGSNREFAAGVTPLQVAESISSRLAQDVLAASINGEEWDLSRPVNADSSIKLFKWDDTEAKHAFWHSSAHLMASAIMELFPETKLAIRKFQAARWRVSAPRRSSPPWCAAAPARGTTGSSFFPLWTRADRTPGATWARTRCR